MNKKVIIIGVIGALLSTIFILGCFLDDKHVSEVTIPEESTIDLTVGVGSVMLRDGVLAFENWYAFVPGEYIQTVDVDVILYDKEGKTAYQIPTSYYENEEVESLYDGSAYRLRYSGFQAYVLESDIENRDYSIILYYNTNDHDGYYYTGYGINAGGELYEE